MQETLRHTDAEEMDNEFPEKKEIRQVYIGGFAGDTYYKLAQDYEAVVINEQIIHIRPKDLQDFRKLKMWITGELDRIKAEINI